MYSVAWETRITHTFSMISGFFGEPTWQHWLWYDSKTTPHKFYILTCPSKYLPLWCLSVWLTSSAANFSTAVNGVFSGTLKLSRKGKFIIQIQNKRSFMCEHRRTLCRVAWDPKLRWSWTWPWTSPCNGQTQHLVVSRVDWQAMAQINVHLWKPFLWLFVVNHVFDHMIYGRPTTLAQCALRNARMLPLPKFVSIFSSSDNWV